MALVTNEERMFLSNRSFLLFCTFLYIILWCFILLRAVQSGARHLSSHRYSDCPMVLSPWNHCLFKQICSCYFCALFYQKIMGQLWILGTCLFFMFKFTCLIISYHFCFKRTPTIYLFVLYFVHVDFVFGIVCSIHLLLIVNKARPIWKRFFFPIVLDYALYAQQWFIK